MTGAGVGQQDDSRAAAGFRKGENIMELGEGLKKILLAGIGTAAVTAEKSKEILDELVKKGELTVEQGKVLNQELKHNIKETIKTKTTPAPKAPKEDIKDTLAKLSPEQLAELKEQILKMEAPKAEEEPKAEEAPKEEAPAAAEEPAQETTEE